MTRKRKTRPEPEREGYDRGYSTSFRDSDSWDWPGQGDGDERTQGDGSGNGGAEDRAGWTDAIGDGVRMGYRVIEEQIRQGQRVAEQINDRFYQSGPGGMGAMGGPDITQKMWRSYWDLAAMWWDFMGSMTGGGTGFRGQPPGWGNGQSNDGYSGHPGEPAEGERLDLAIEVESERATRVGLVLNHLRGCRSLVALKLHGPGDAVLGGEVEFGPIVDGAPLRVEIRVPADQAPGAYSGRVVDGSSGEHLGTLTVQVE